MAHLVRWTARTLAIWRAKARVGGMVCCASPLLTPKIDQLNSKTVAGSRLALPAESLSASLYDPLPCCNPFFLSCLVATHVFSNMYSYQGYCDFYGSCKVVDSDDVLNDLEDLLNPAAAVSWIKGNWPYLAGAVGGAGILAGLLKLTYRKRKLHRKKYMMDDENLPLLST